MANDTDTKVIALCRQAPYGSALAREGLEAVLAAAAMDRAPDILFCGDGVFQLVPGQFPEPIRQKSLQRNLQALPVFGVEVAMVCAHSLRQRGLSLDALLQDGPDLQAVEDVAALLGRYDIVLNF